MVNKRTNEQIALEICERAGINVDINIPQFVGAQCVVIKSSYLFFPTEGQDGVLYVDKSNMEIYIYDVEAMEYQAVTQKLNPMIDEEVKEILEYISSHKDEYNALVELVGDKANQTDLTALQSLVESLRSQIRDLSHSHNNQDILDATTASYTIEEQDILNEHSEAIKELQSSIGNNGTSVIPMTDEEIIQMFDEVFND